MAYRNVIFPLVGTGNMNQYATGLSLTMDSNYVISAQLTNKNGEYIGTEQSIDLPLESVVVSGSYDPNTKSLVLTLDNGNEITIPVSDLVSGLQAEITTENPLSADLLTDGSTNKVFTATEQSKLSGIAEGAEVNVQADWNQSDNTADDFIKNKPSIPAAQVNSDWNASSGVAEILNKPVIPTVNDSTITIQQDGTTVGTFTTNDANDTTINLTGGGGNDWYGTQMQFDALGTYDPDTNYYITDKLDYNTDLKNKPDLSVYATKTEVKTKNDQQDGVIAGKLGGVFMTQAEFDQITPSEGQNYFIEGQTVEVVVTFTDQTTATYNVVVD